MPSGRPTIYTDELADAICGAIATTSSGLDKICERDDFPDPATIYRWLRQNETFCEKYARARQDQAQILADEIVTIADTPQEGVIITEKKDGTEIKRADMIEHRKLQVDARKWLASKLLPKKYGDKMEHTGEGLRVVVDMVRPERGTENQ